MEVPEAELERHAALLELAMTYELSVYDGRKVTVPVELKSGRSWGEMVALPPRTQDVVVATLKDEEPHEHNQRSTTP